MKNLTIFSIVMFWAFMLACGEKPNTDIIGTWTISDISTSKDIPDSIKPFYEESIAEMKASYLLVIKADSTFEKTISESTGTGKWSLSKDLKFLTLSFQNGEKEVSSILELTSDKLVTSIDFNESKSTISFVKQKEEQKEEQKIEQKEEQKEEE